MNGPVIWAISPEEREKHDQKFDTLSPSMGYISGDQARKFFLQSGLPASVLAEIWTLADMNMDGKMDRLEFSIAMKLIKLKLQGTALPSALPIIMKQPPVPAPTSVMPSPNYGIGSMPMMPGSSLAMLTPMSMASPGLSPLTPMTGLSPYVPASTGLNPLMASTPARPMMPTLGNNALPSGTIGFLPSVTAGPMTAGLPLSATSYLSPAGHSASPAAMNSPLLDLGSSAPSSLSMMSPMNAVPSDWAVPHASRLKYRQQFNILDKQMTGFLTGPQVRNAMATTMLTQTQLASIWNLSDVDKDGKLKAEEFILAMHLVDLAKTGQPLPLTLPPDLVPPSHRSAVNGSGSSFYSAMIDDLDMEPPQKARTNMSFEDKFKANMEQGNAELEKRRQALLEAERREQERRAQKEKEEQERKEREAREAEERRRRREEEQRLERQRELERQKEEERQREVERREAAQRELERQRKEEFERRKRGELQIKKEQEQDEIIKLKAKKRSLEMELEAVGNKQRQISDRLRDIQNKKKIQETELDLNIQRKETRQQDIYTLHKQIEEFQRKLSQLTPEKKKLTEKLQNMSLNNLPVSAMSALKVNVSEKTATCVKLREQLEALERETSAKLVEMDRCNKDMQELRENQRKQQNALEKLRTVKEEKQRELIRKKEQERKRQEEEEQRRMKMEVERQEKLRREEEERQRRLQEEREAKRREEEEKARQALLQAAREQAERELRAKEEAERKRKEEEERKKREEEERQRQAERRRQEEERRKLEEERRKLEEERRKLEDARRQEERRRKEEEDRKRKEEEERRRLEEETKRLEEERKRLEEERRENERRREREEEERRRHRAAEAALRDSEERRKRDEEERRKKEEDDRRKREEDRRRLQQDEERRRREDEKKKAEEERKRKEEEEEERRKAELERKRKEEASRQQQPNGGKVDVQEKLMALLRGLEERKGGKPKVTQHRKSAALTSFKALYPFTARNNEELSFSQDDIIEVDETTEREEGWLYGSRQGKMGWFPESYVEKVGPSNTTNTPAAAPKVPIQTQLTNALEAAKAAGTKSAFTPTHSPNSAPSETRGQPVVGNVFAQALCSWTGKADNHLNFNKDDVIRVLEQQESWWLGELNGERGWVPKNYVTLLGEEEGSDTKSSPPDAAESVDSLQHEEYVALYTYESPQHTDLTFKEGDVILVNKKEGEWWNGSTGERSGLFPSNYVKPKEADASSISGKKKQEIAQVTRAHSSAGPDQLNLENGQLILVFGKNSSGWWLGELQARGKKRQKGWFPSSHVKILSSTSGKSTPAPQPVCQVTAIYDYTAANQDELSFSAGQLINVLDKNDPDWWKGEVNGVTGLFPTNYIKMSADSDPSQQWSSDQSSSDSLNPLDKKRQGYIDELIESEERYVEDLQVVLEVFYKPMSESGRLNKTEMDMIFVNWKDLLACNSKLVKALRPCKKSGGENTSVQKVGDVLAAELTNMQPYIRFCSSQFNGAALLQTRTDNEPDFKSFLKKIATDYRCKGMPLSSFLLKPMQRITRYPLHIKKILECTPEGHADRALLKEALETAEELCQQVNEGVREKENSERLDWIQNHVQCEGPLEHLVFNSLTSCLGPRKLVHSGKLHKAKSNKELWAFLFNDFLLLTHAAKQFTSSGPDKLFSNKNNVQLKMYKPPVLLNEVLVKLPDPSSDEPVFHISHIDRVYTLRTDNINERTAWVQKIKVASEEFIETENKKREKVYQGRSVKASGIGRLLVTILEATELRATKPNGKSNCYCEVTMGSQTFTSRTLSDTLNPKWNFSCQFHIRDLYQDVLCITINEKDQFSPDVFLGRTEVPVATIKKELENKGPVTRRLLLHEVSTGEVWVRLDLQLFANQ